MTNTIVKCDECQMVKSNTDRWFKVVTEVNAAPPTFQIYRAERIPGNQQGGFDRGLIFRSVFDICGAVCLTKLLNKWLEAVR